jgi:hypothetical protein
VVSGGHARTGPVSRVEPDGEAVDLGDSIAQVPDQKDVVGSAAWIQSVSMSA